jgi:hypothetical protein
MDAGGIDRSLTTKLTETTKKNPRLRLGELGDLGGGL